MFKDFKSYVSVNLLAVAGWLSIFFWGYTSISLFFTYPIGQHIGGESGWIPLLAMMLAALYMLTYVIIFLFMIVEFFLRRTTWYKIGVNINENNKHFLFLIIGFLGLFSPIIGTIFYFIYVFKFTT